MVASAIAQVLEDVIREPDVVQLAPDERVPMFMTSGIVKCIGGDIDQAGLDQVERRIERPGRGTPRGIGRRPGLSPRRSRARYRDPPAAGRCGTSGHPSLLRPTVPPA